MERDFTFEETIAILKRVNSAWDEFGNTENSNDNPYNMITEGYYDEFDGDGYWKAFGIYTLPFVSSPVSSEVARRQCLHYYKENEKNYLRIGDYRYVINDAVENIIKDFLN